jgi:putative major fimbrial subunit
VLFLIIYIIVKLLLHRICKNKSDQLIILILYERQEILMKKLTLAASLVLGLSIAIGASANDGTVTFIGKIVDQTCQVETGSKNLTVKLPTISKSALPSVGSFAGRTAFDIKVTGCTANKVNASKVAAYFLPNAQYVDETSHNLLNTAAGANADKVQIQLLQHSVTGIIPVGENIGVQYPDNPSSNDYVTIGTNGQASLRYYAQYYAAKAGVEPTDVNAKVEYDIVYK